MRGSGGGGETREGVWRAGMGRLQGLEFCGEEWVWVAEDGGFCAAEGGDYDVWVIVFVDLQESCEVLIVKRETLLFQTAIRYHL